MPAVLRRCHSIVPVPRTGYVPRTTRKPAMFRRLAPLIFVLLASPALGQQQAMLDQALDTAIATFEAARPHLDQSKIGVDTAAYRDALTFRRFASTHWGGTVTVDIAIRETRTGSCTRFAAFIRIPPENGTVRLVLCPQFFSDGAEDLRVLTLLHEMVHAVAGPDECRAMAFAARVEQAAAGRFTPVDAYWQANGCADSGYKLP